MTESKNVVRPRRTSCIPAMQTALTVALLMTIAVSHAFAYQATASNDPTNMLLGELWQRTGKESAQSKTLGESALVTNPADQHLVYAFALNRMKHYRFQDAVKILSSSPGESATRLESWIIRTWSEAVMGQHDRSLVSLREMKRSMQTDPPPPDAQQLKFYRHAGKMIGYFQGPVVGSPNADFLQSTIETIANGATAAQLALFNAERTAVLDRFEQLSRDEASAQEQFLKEAEAKGVVQADTIKNNNETLAQRQSQIQPEVGRLTSEANTKISGLDQQAGPLIAQANAAEAQLNQISWNLNSIRGDIFFLQSALANEQDPVIRNSLQWQLNQLYSLSRNAQYDLVAARSRLVGLQSQLNVLGVQRATVSTTYGTEIQQQKDELKQLDLQQRKNEKRLEDIIDGPNRVTGEALALANKKDLLSTYYVLPLEVFRQDFLDELAAKKKNPVQ